LSIIPFLKSVCDASGSSGHEHNVRQLIKNQCSDLADEIIEDNLGNLIILKKGSGHEKEKRKIMIAAHMDEIGFMVTKIDDNGFLRFTNIGGIDYRVLLHQEVYIGEKRLYGIIGSKPSILQSQEDWKKSFKIEELFIDVGLPANKAKKIVNIGDPVTLCRELGTLHNETCYGKALDDRAGVAVLYQCLKELNRINHIQDVYLVATVQEEVGLRGAVVSSYNINPDIGIAVDVGHGDMPGVPEEDTNQLSKGPGIAIGPNIHPKIFEKLAETAKNYNIPYQINTAPGATGTDAWAIQITLEGIPTGLLSIPLRYMHTSVEVLNTKDIVNTGRLLAFFAASMETGFVEGLSCF
jgi:putative aminopeptidase FrvX